MPPDIASSSSSCMSTSSLRPVFRGAAAKRKGRTLAGPPFRQCGWLAGYEQPDVVPQLTHLWQLPLGIMIDPHSGQVGASVRAMKL